MRHHRRAFTLVELLVVIGIIAVLVAILLPALSVARRQGQKAKCAAQMRDIGMSMLFYAQDNKGYLPPIRLNNITYQIDNLTYHKGAAESIPNGVINENAKWWHFLGKYVTKKQPMAQTGDQMNAMTSSVFWCPAFPGYVDAGSAANLIGGLNRNFIGFGMNWWPSFSTTNPATGTDFPPTAEQFADSLTSPTKWYKLKQFTHPQERALLADASQFYLEAKAVPSSDAIPGQRLLFSTNDYSSGVTGQTTFDFYRHGKYPGVANAGSANGYFSPNGGKISYNILYADNHVAEATDRETGYRACRSRFPN